MSPDGDHTFGPACRLAPIPETEPVKGLEDIPPIKAQFFYSSPISIDDPFSAAIIVSSAEAKPSKFPLRPFSTGDSLELERAWLGFASGRARKNHRQSLWKRDSSPALSKENAAKVSTIVAQLVMKHIEKHDREGQSPATAAVCCPELPLDVSAELRKEFCAVTRRHQRSLDQDKVVQGIMAELKRLRRTSDTPRTAQVGSLLIGTSPFSSHIGATDTRPSTASGDGELPPLASLPARPPPTVDDGISGTPFARVQPAPKSTSTTPEDRSTTSRIGCGIRTGGESRTSGQPVAEGAGKDTDSAEIPVGVSRLHMVSLPVLQMKPIYWSPVNDIAVVSRATWFYRFVLATICSNNAHDS